ncbi:heavy metal-associated domain-containing protein [Actinopolymorpha sp. B11F2]|uniref:heavy-metal-associated domain-containing protein n=1 Tax=Actinopolymorpha sp. B11F2 TaxID=3160862 RepID=UPI0032E4A8A2
MGSTVETYPVAGMTCGHCASSVSAGLEAVPGVCQVDVDLPSGNVRVTSAEPLTTDLVRAAVEGAGFSLAD